MADTIQFVDKIDALHFLALDLNDGTTWRTLAKVDMSPPPLRRSVAGTLLRDGAVIPASAYGNRVLGLTLRVSATSEANLATELTKLHRELDKPRNIIKYQRDGGAAPVFFRTFRSPDYTLDSSAPDPIVKVGVNIIAEPFAYGLREDLGPFTIDNDPASAGNPQFVDISGILGDIPTPIYCFEGNIATESYGLLATRRHGTPSNMTWQHQAEGMTQDVDTTVQANDATASGPGSNYSATTFANATLQRRLYKTIPASGTSVDFRGRYRVFVRIRKPTASGATYNVQVRYTAIGGLSAIANPAVSFAGSGEEWSILDLGLVPIPTGSDGKIDAYTGTELATEGIRLELWAERLTGSQDLDWDYVILIPADEELALLNWGAIVLGTYHSVVDGPNDLLYRVDSATSTIKSTVATSSFFIGGIPLLAPGETNRIFVLKQVTGGSDNITHTTPLTVRYWPRYLYIR